MPTQLSVLQEEVAALPARQEGAETPARSLDLPRERFAQLVQQEHAAAQAGKSDRLPRPCCCDSS